MNFPYQLQTMEQYQKAYAQSVQDPETFWANIADNFTWKRKWDTVLDWNFSEPSVQWFKGAQLNITENCLDRHLETRGHEPAIIWESNNPEEHHRVLTYNELHFKVQQFANVLLNNGVQKGDRVCIYMGMIPELAIATLACARIGAIHSVIFGGFSAQAIADRLDDAGAQFIVTCDGAFRGAKDIALKMNCAETQYGQEKLRKTPNVLHLAWERAGPWSNAVYLCPFPYRPTGIVQGKLEEFAAELSRREGNGVLKLGE